MTNKNNIPAIRFKGFTDTWEQCELGEVGSCQSGIGFPDSEQGGTEGIPFFKVSDMNISGNEYELLFSNNYVTHEQIERKKWKPITEVPAMFFAKVGAAVMLNRKRLVNMPFLLDNNTMAYKFDDAWDSNFGRTLFDTINLSSLVQVGALPSYNANDVESIKIALPTSEEQQKIGTLFTHLDRLITLHQRKLDKLHKVKKSLLEKMFPRNGSDVPEVRFKGYTNAWEQLQFGDLGSVAMNKRVFKHQTSDSGDIPFYKIGTFGGIPDAFISRALFEEYKSKYPYPNNGDILISASGSIGRTVVFTGKEEYFQDSNIVWLKHDDRLRNIFLRYLYEVVKWAGIEGSTIKRLYNDNILKTSISLPSIEEQDQIGQFLTSLDSLITLHQRKCDMLRNLKKALLEKMFV